MFNCCLGINPQVYELKKQEDDTLTKEDDILTKEDDFNYILPNDKYFYKILISRLLESSNYLINSLDTEYYSLAFIYYFFLFFGCCHLINNNLDKFIEYFDLETDIISILEILSSIKACLKPSINFIELDIIPSFIVKIDEKTIFEKVNMFWFKIDDNQIYQNFIVKYKKLKKSDFEKMKCYLKTLMISIDQCILNKFLY